MHGTPNAYIFFSREIININVYVVTGHCYCFVLAYNKRVVYRFLSQIPICSSVNSWDYNLSSVGNKVNVEENAPVFLSYLLHFYQVLNGWSISFDGLSHCNTWCDGIFVFRLFSVFYFVSCFWRWGSTTHTILNHLNTILNTTISSPALLIVSKCDRTCM